VEPCLSLLGLDVLMLAIEIGEARVVWQQGLPWLVLQMLLNAVVA